MNIPVTKTIVRYGITVLILTAIFLTVLHFSIENGWNIAVLVSAICFGVLMFASGLFWGLREKESTDGLGISLAFNLIGFICYNLVMFIWIAVFAQSNMSWYGYVAGGWTAALFIHGVVGIIVARKIESNR